MCERGEMGSVQGPFSQLRLSCEGYCRCDVEKSFPCGARASSILGTLPTVQYGNAPAREVLEAFWLRCTDPQQVSFIGRLFLRASASSHSID